MRVPWAVALEKYERMSALPVAKVRVAARKHSPTRTAVFVTDVGVGVAEAMAGTDVAGVCSIDRSSVAVFMVTPLMGLRCKYRKLTA
jgi:hypothetical protein